MGKKERIVFLRVKIKSVGVSVDFVILRTRENGLPHQLLCIVQYLKDNIQDVYKDYYI